jgi:Gpi18-like mannosyltransferase
MIESLKVAEDRPQGWVAWTRIASWAAAALMVAAIAAASASGAATGKFPGFVAGAIMIALVIYAFIDYLQPLTDDPDSGLIPALLALAALSLIKLLVMPYFPGFGPDVGDYQAWASQIGTFGPAHTYQKEFFLDYPPGYLYALWVVGIIAHGIGATGDFYRIIIQSPSIVADFALAILVYAYMRRGGRAEWAFIAMLMVAMNPALLFDTVVWGQSDSVMTFVIMLSIVAILGKQYEIAWGLAAIAVLVKPQGLMMLPVLGLWTMLETNFATWIRSGIALIAVAIIGVAPFQIGHEWNWIVKLYGSTAAYYHETSVNAFNLMALLGGLRQADTNTLAGVSFFALGMSLLIPLYGFVAWILWSGRTPTRLLFASFIAIFGFFMVAPRMHERYLYPAIALAAPLALEAPEMLGVFAILTITCFINLIYILHTLNTVVFLDSRDVLAMVTSALNVVALGLAVYWGSMRMQDGGSTAALSDFFGKFAMPTRQIEDYVEESASTPPWIATDTIIISVLLIAAAITRFWNLGHPAEIVFDEVHFVAQGRHYLHGESFLDPHPPLAKLVISLGILLFGDNPFGWRVGNATIGTALVGISYLIGRRISGSRLVGALAGAIILCDGMYLVDSHYAVIDIVYLTCAAVAYLLFFKFAEMRDAKARRRILPWIGLALGLCLASKLYIPAITFLLVMGFIVYVLASDHPKTEAPAPEPVETRQRKIKASERAPVGLDLFDQTSVLFIALICIVLGLVLFLSGATAGYIVLSIVAVLAIRLGEIYWRNRSSMSAAESWQMPSMRDLLVEPMTVGAVVLVGSVAAITYLAVFLPHFWLGWWGGI